MILFSYKKQWSQGKNPALSSQVLKKTRKWSRQMMSVYLGGILECWDPNKENLNPFLVSSSILLTGDLVGFNEEVIIFNVDGPYQ